MPAKHPIILAFVAIAWLSVGRRLTLTGSGWDHPGEIFAVSPLQYTEGGIGIGSRKSTSPQKRETKFLSTPVKAHWHGQHYWLGCKKRTGAKLEMLWRSEQGWYSDHGWSPPGMMWNYRTGLLSVDIHPESAGADGVAVEYLRRTNCWNRRQYRIESRGPGVFAVVYLDDERSLCPGRGQSVELQIDPVSHWVVKEVHGQ